MNIQWSKQPHYIRSAFETCIFSMFLLFWKVKSLLISNLFFSQYIDQIPRSEEMKEALLEGKTPDWKPLFLLKMKIKQNPGRRNKAYNAIFEHIHQIIRACPRSKKFCIDQWLWKYYCILGKNPSKARCRQTHVVCSKYIWGVRGSVPYQKNFAFSILI